MLGMRSGGTAPPSLACKARWMAPGLHSGAVSDCSRHLRRCIFVSCPADPTDSSDNVMRTVRTRRNASMILEAFEAAEEAVTSAMESQHSASALLLPQLPGPLPLPSLRH